MINVNLTVFIQLITLLALVVLLNLLMFQPILRVLERREKVLRDQNALREEFTRLAGEKTRSYDDRILASRMEAMNLRVEARSQAAAALRAMVQKARDENIAEVEKARKALAGAADQARAGMKEQVRTLAGELSATLLGRAAGGK